LHFHNSTFASVADFAKRWSYYFTFSGTHISRVDEQWRKFLFDHDESISLLILGVTAAKPFRHFRVLKDAWNKQSVCVSIVTAAVGTVFSSNDGLVDGWTMKDGD
jgi:hypothetical protein